MGAGRLAGQEAVVRKLRFITLGDDQGPGVVVAQGVGRDEEVQEVMGQVGVGACDAPRRMQSCRIQWVSRRRGCLRWVVWPQGVSSVEQGLGGRGSGASAGE